MTLRIRPARLADLESARSLLQDAGLPTADLAADHLALVADQDGDFLGVVGLESFGEVALLRSLVISTKVRGTGIGPALVTALETASTCDGVEEMWLLTIDADPFFRKLGYEVRERADAPPSIQGTEEFSNLCPGDAVLMSKSLARSVQ